MVKAHPTIKGVFSKFHSHVEKHEPTKALRPRLVISVNDTVNTGKIGAVKTSTIDEACRLLTVELAMITPEGRKVLIKQHAKVSPSLGTFYEGDQESERDVALAVEGLVNVVVVELATAGACSILA